MSFYMIINSKVVAHEFDYLEGNTGRRLDQTISPHMKKPVKADESVEAWVAEIMSKQVITLSSESTVQEAVEIFKDKRMHHIPIVKNDKLVGIISDRDIMWLDQMEMGKYTSLDQFMNSIVVVCHEDTSVDHLAHVFCEEEINGMPVINSHNKLVGMVTNRDILRWIYKK